MIFLTVFSVARYYSISEKGHEYQFPWNFTQKSYKKTVLSGAIVDCKGMEEVVTTFGTMKTVK